MSMPLLEGSLSTSSLSTNLHIDIGYPQFSDDAHSWIASFESKQLARRLQPNRFLSFFLSLLDGVAVIGLVHSLHIEPLISHLMKRVSFGFWFIRRIYLVIAQRFSTVANGREVLIIFYSTILSQLFLNNIGEICTNIICTNDVPILIFRPVHRISIMVSNGRCVQPSHALSNS